MDEFRKSRSTLLEEFNSSINGISPNEASKRLLENGENTLQVQSEPNFLIVFLKQFRDLLVVVLFLAAIISFWSGNIESSLVIIAVLILNAVLGTVQQLKARKSLKALKTLSSPSAKVTRDGQTITIPSKDVVIGDIVLVEAGDLIVADGRILINHSLKVNESSLTGESESVIKTDDVLNEEKLSLGDRKNMVFSGSFVTYGRASVLVTSTGMDSEIGKITSLMNKAKPSRTPLQKSLDKFSKTLAISITIICALVFLLEWHRNQGSILNALVFSIALAVAAIPEALSSIVTIVQAMGTQKMVRENAIIKDLKAVETLGSVSVICSDKTGTLTQNKMTVQNIYCDNFLKESKQLNISSTTEKLLVTIAVLTNDSVVNKNSSIGDPTEIALVNFANGFGIEETELRKEIPRLFEIPFDSDRKLMSTVHLIDGKRTLFTKGAPDVLLKRSKFILNNQGFFNLNNEEIEKIDEINQILSKEGLRVLAFGFKELKEGEEVSLNSENGLTFLGLISMMDPPREESIRAVEDAKLAGIKTVMITGDHKTTASAIAKRLSILTCNDIAISGTELEKMSDDELLKNISNISVYARVTPNDKIRIVECFQRKNAIVSMTGDGVNDAPALKKADIGVAMGITGTEVAKDAASMILTDDNFSTIIKAVHNGRNVYENIKNSIKFLLSGNTAGIIAVLFTVLFPSLVPPFEAVQLLFINLITDSLPALAIGMENSRDDLLKKPPRNPNKSILDKPALISIGIQGLLISIATLIAYFYGFNISPALASTFAFSTLTMARLFHGFNCRGFKNIFSLKLFSNIYCVYAFLVGTALLTSVLFLPPLMRIFSVVSISIYQYIFIIILAFIPTLIIQIFKIVRDYLRK